MATSYPMRYLTSALIKQAIFCHEALPLVYVNNPKAACSTIKASLWGYYTGTTPPHGKQIHLKNGEPFIEDLSSLPYSQISALLQKPIFSMVRNPYTRILSSYRFKVVGPDENMKRYFCDRYFLKYDQLNEDNLPFQDFLKIIAFDHPGLLNPHFREQSINLLIPFLPYNFIGCLENRDALTNFLQTHNVTTHLQNITVEQTEAPSISCYLTPSACSLIKTIFANDFATFGYSRNPDLCLKEAKLNNDFLGTGLLE